MDSKIKIIKDGPYLVSKDIPLYERELVEQDGLIVLKTIRKIDVDSDYALCRCGKSSNHPFCDGSHTKCEFDGTETAGFSKYEDRAELLEGETINLLDDNRCAFARFCHKENGDIWTLTENSNNPESKKQAVEAANQCPTGRLTIMTLDGDLIEPELEPSISFIRDVPKHVDGGLFVTGNIPLESADNKLYETRNRYALCRCGASNDKPFCDAMHVSIKFNR
ncbi:CDGSH-type Zn-finger protein [Bacilli bacterium PM5-3]|nr:CDGSH-type Zn-finger protein [Bacilli bacterium PM5-3]MDH6603598.1 CDGSH-type Zn-finger protein [Bacilli bacterium PM5-9]